jgi:hypothetical protein
MMTEFKSPTAAGGALPAEPALPAELALWLQRSQGVLADAALAGADPAHAAVDPSLPAGVAVARVGARDAVLRALAHRFFPGVPVSIQASLIALRAERFALVQWPRDRERAQIPARYRDTPDEYLWAAFKAGAPMPVGKRELRRILIGIPENDPDEAGSA